MGDLDVPIDSCQLVILPPNGAKVIKQELSVTKGTGS